MILPNLLSNLQSIGHSFPEADVHKYQFVELLIIIESVLAGVDGLLAGLHEMAGW